MKALSWVAALALCLGLGPGLVAGTSVAMAQGAQRQGQGAGPPLRKSGPTAGTAAPTKAWLGVQLAVDDDGTRIAEVIQGTPAAKVGLMVDDYILQVGTQSVRMPVDVTSQVNRMSVGEVIRLRIRRKRAVFDASLRLTATVSAAELLHRRLVGQDAPDFDLPVVHGSDATRLTVSGFRGRVVVLEFWATWCQNCGEVHRLLSEALASCEDKDDSFVVLSVAAEPPNQIRDYVQRHSLAYPVLFDRYAQVRDRYHAPSLPTLVVIDQKGIVRFARAGAGENVQDALAHVQRLRRLDDGE